MDTTRLRLPTSAVTAALVAACVFGHRGSVSLADLRAGGTGFQDDTASILRAFGQPLRRTHVGSVSTGSLDTWYYPHAEVLLYGGRSCDQLLLLDSTYATAGGVRVGDPLAKALRIYGTPKGQRLMGDTLLAWYDLKGGGMLNVLALKTTADTIRSIRMGMAAFVFM